MLGPSILNGLAFLTGIAAAWLWWKASLVKIPTPVTGLDSADLTKGEFARTVTQASRLNGKAAVVTGVSAAFTAAASLWAALADGLFLLHSN